MIIVEIRVFIRSVTKGCSKKKSSGQKPEKLLMTLLVTSQNSSLTVSPANSPLSLSSLAKKLL
jgi:hypothetical protein